MKTRPLVCAVLLLTGEVLTAQTPYAVEPLSQRLSDLLRGSAAIQLMSPTRHALLLRARGRGSWASPRFALFVDGEPLSSFPLNFESPDVAAADQLVLDSLRIVSRPALINGVPVFGGALLLTRRSIPDSFVAAGRAFAGSETGDPGIHSYTRDQLSLGNRQKIGISASALVSNRSGDFAYRVHAASLGHFATGYSSTDPLIFSYRHVSGRDQSTNRFLRGEAWYNLPNGGSFGGEVAVHGVAGWDMLPFFPTFVHYSLLKTTASVSARDVAPGLLLALNWEKQRFVLDEQFRSARGEFTLLDYTLGAEWDFWRDRASVLSIIGRLRSNNLSIPETSPVASPQPFAEGFRRWSGSLAGRVRGGWGRMRWVFSAGVDRFLNGRSECSAGGGAEYQLDDAQSIELSAASIAGQPSISELFGRYETSRERPELGRVDSLTIAGNPGLQAQRAESVDLGYRRMTDRLGVTLTLFLQNVRHPIGRTTTAILRSQMPGDVVFAGLYENLPRQFLYGVEAGCAVELGRDVKLSGGYVFLQNRDVPDAPEHACSGQVTLDVFQGMMLELCISGNSVTQWKSFRVEPSEDDLAGAGIDGVLPERWLVDVSVTQRVEELWFVRYLDVRLELLNVFDRKYRLLPTGADLSMAALAYISVGL